ncbi:hypothetical protein TRAPUB_2476 [Trametes pubescens]|uniref:EF-hand domain-containing protein n=1 Tax=Trametes pubescens TaxID=154538 RepID=A0A1M2VGL2_TRAPU|nr:hypothetical protein TRAPUB_2476 [Trametes pubescens]
MSLNVHDSGEGKSPSLDSIKRARDAMARAAQPNEPSCAGKLEEKILDSANAEGDAASSSVGLGILLDGVNAITESLPVLVCLLDALAKVHPFLEVAVGAFKVVVELEGKRHDNDKKVKLLFFEMHNMMATLLQLRDIDTGHGISHSGLSIGARLEVLVKKTAKDIEECANACNAYSRKRLLVKVLQAPSWNERLKDYVSLFRLRKSDFNIVISSYVSTGVQHANVKLDTLNTNMDAVMQVFVNFAPHEQRVLAEVVDRVEGGVKGVLVKPNVLKDLLLKEQRLEAAMHPSDENGSPAGRRIQSGGVSYVPVMTTPYVPWMTTPYAPQMTMPGSTPYYSRAAETQRLRNRPDNAQGSTPYEPLWYYPGRNSQAEDVFREGEESEGSPETRRLMQDLADEPAMAIQKNLVFFARKFAIQQRELVREMTEVVKYECERVIAELRGGPHERIIDPDLSEIWKDMQWRGIVKARHLVLALHDHFAQKIDDQQRAVARGTSPQHPVSESDRWALECLDLMHLQQIIEALDTDASGFITVQEVNNFTTSRPNGWSLLHWLAYWAVGWQVAMAEYRSKIYALLARMHKLRVSVRVRGPAVQEYLDEVVPLVKEMTQSFREDPDRRSLFDRFRWYVEQEEKRLREGLETAKYDLDALETLALINGPAGLERNLFIVLYLLLRRHHDIMAVGKKVILHPKELFDAISAIQLVKDAFDYRAQDLIGLFTQRRLPVDLELRDFACGMLLDSYKKGGKIYSHDTDDWAQTLDDVKLGETTGGPPEAMLKYPQYLEEFYPQSEDSVHSEDSEANEDLKPLLGRWAGVTTSVVDGALSHRSFNFDFHVCPSDSKQVIAVPLSMPGTYIHATLMGTFTGRDKDGRRTYVISNAYNTSALPVGYTKVVLSENGSTLEGEKDVAFSFSTSDPNLLRVVIKKGSSPEIMQFYPQPSELQGNTASALWRFSISAVLYEVRRRRLSWGFIKERRDRKHLLASLLLAELRNGSLHADDVAERVRLVNRTTPSDLHYFAYASVEPGWFPWVLPWCAECKRVLRTAVPCLRCAVCTPPEEAVRGVALCDRAECLTSHLRDGVHRILKTREVGWALGVSKEDNRLDEGKLTRLYYQAADVFGRGIGRGGRLPSPPRYWSHPLPTVAEVTGESGELQRGLPETGPAFVGPPAFDRGTDGPALPAGFVPLRIIGSPRKEDATSSPVPVRLGTPSEPTSVLPGPAVQEASAGEVGAPNEDPPLIPRCIGCDVPILTPAWVCVECSDPTYVCLNCDERKSGLSLGAHEAHHILLRIGATVPNSRSSPSSTRRRTPFSIFQEVPASTPWHSSGWPALGQGVSEARICRMEDRMERTLWGIEDHLWINKDSVDDHLWSVDDRLSSIDDRLSSSEDRLIAMEKRMEALENRLTDGLARIDHMFTTVLSALHRSGSPSS